MSESVQALIAAIGNTLKPGDVYALNNPYNGGTHLPDITVITPVFEDGSKSYSMSPRGHHADIGGITPGSMPPNSCTVEQEGVLIDISNWWIRVTSAKRVTELLSSGEYPARNPGKNVADLQAQIAANERGVQELRKMVEHFGLETVQATWIMCRTMLKSQSVALLMF